MRYALCLILSTATACAVAAAEEEPHRHRWCNVGSSEMRACCVYRERIDGEMRCTKKGLAACQPKICSSCPATSESCTSCMATD